MCRLSFLILLLTTVTGALACGTDVACLQAQVAQLSADLHALRASSALQTACPYLISSTLLSLTFSSPAECDAFAAAQTFGGTRAVGYSNCSLGTFCYTGTNAVTVSNLWGFDLVSLAASYWGTLSLSFSTADLCVRTFRTANRGANTRLTSCDADNVLYISGNGNAIYVAASTSAKSLGVLGLSAMN